MIVGARAYAAWFEHWVDEQPDALALTGDDGGCFTYGELEEASNRVANAVDAHDPGRLFPCVAVALEQSTDAAVAIVGAVKTGRTVVPIDPASPPGRVAQMLAQVDPAVVLVAGGTEAALGEAPAHRWTAVRVDELSDARDATRPFHPVTAEELHLVLFTSGSTGTPKGVTRLQGTTASLLEEAQRLTWQGPGARLAVVADYQWLAGWGAIRNPLCTGASAHLYATRRRGPADLAQWLVDERITGLVSVPSLVRSMLDHAPAALRFPDLQRVRFGGDVLLRSLVVDLFDRLPPGARVDAAYSSSEAGSVAALSMTADALPDDDVVPAGHIIPGVTVEIADADADGVGRLVVMTRRGASQYLAGTVSSDAMTCPAPGVRRHLTGDRGRIRPDGMLELRGREDHTVKVRGQRIDVSEIEAALRRLPDVREAVAGLHPGAGEDRLVGWVVPRPGGDVSVRVLRQGLRAHLPGYMVPSAFVRLDGLPRSTRGKLDRFALPAPEPGRPDLGHAFEPPVGRIEEAVAAAFAHVLEVEPVGRHDDFGDLGGDSLRAAEAMTLMAATLGRDVPLSVFLEASTPAELARHFEAPRHDAADRLVVLQAEGGGPPVYCLHGGGGQVLSFAPLAERLGPAQPFIGVQMRARDAARRLFWVRALARRYADLIAERQHGRPCTVAGHSYGGLLAQEVARLLADRGHPVERCILLDTGLPSRRSLRPRARLAPERAVPSIKDLLYAVHSLAGLRPRPHRVNTERMVSALWGIALHRPRLASVPLVVVRAADLPGDRGMARWRGLTDVGCTFLEVPGDHQSILTAPHVADLASALGPHLG